MNPKVFTAEYHEERLSSYDKEEIYAGIGDLYEANELQAKTQGFAPEVREDYRKYSRIQLKKLAARLQAQNYCNAAKSFTNQQK